MTQREALEIVLELALENVVNINDSPLEHAKQMEAYDIMYNALLHVFE